MPSTRTRTHRALGCLLAGAIGDALGSAIEFDSWRTIAGKYGPGGLDTYAPAYGRRGAITDDTQMTLFTAEALTGVGPADREVSLWAAYRRWLATQTDRTPGPFASGLAANPALYSQRAPGTTCMSALRRGRPGSVARPANNSKGCGGVMRTAPCGIVATSAQEAFDLGVTAAAMTHGHPSGYLPAGLLAAAVHLLIEGATLDEALDAATAITAGHPGHEETVTAVAEARLMATLAARPTPEEIAKTLGGGWVGEEALAIAVLAALVAEDMEDGLRLAVNHSGDSDSTGSICGQLLGARDGVYALPSDLLADLELADVIADAARQLVGNVPA